MNTTRIKLTLLLLLCLSLNSCGPNFGNKIYDWVSKHTRSYSEQLTRADLRVRWLNAFTESFRTISYYQEKMAHELEELKKQLRSIESILGDNLEKALKQHDLCIATSNRLIQIKNLTDETEELLGTLDSIGSIRQFEAAGLRAVGKETLLRSFMEIGSQSEQINRLRYQKLFHVKYSLVIGENGQIQQQATYDDNGTGSYSGDNMGESLEKFFGSFFATAPIYALFIEDDIEKQVEKIKEALNLFDQLSLQPKEQYLISLEYLKEARDAYKDYRTKVEDLHTQQKTSWKLLWQINATYLYNAETAIAPYKARIAESEFRGSKEIQRIIEEEERYARKNEMIALLAALVAMEGDIVRETNQFRKAELTERYADACAEAECYFDNLHQRYSLLPLYTDIESYQARLKYHKQHAESLKHDLLIP